VGGIELGFERTGGFETAWFVECEPYAQAVLKKHWPNVPIYGDIRKIDFTTLPKVDILTGGFPCQDISNAGKRKGITGERSGLWKEYLRAICEIRPKIVFVENVAALVNRGLNVVLRDLAEIGYDAEWHCLSAADVGAPHKRERIWIIAMENSECNGTNEGNWEENDCRKEKGKHSNFVVGTSARKGNVADSNSKGLQGNNKKESGFGQSKETFGCRSGVVSFSGCNGFIEGKVVEGDKKGVFCESSESFQSGTFERFGGLAKGLDKGFEERKRENRERYWATDAGVLRVANGIPFRVDRIKCLGNSVVPQCSEVFAEIIKEKLERAENEKEKVK